MTLAGRKRRWYPCADRAGANYPPHPLEKSSRGNGAGQALYRNARKARLAMAKLDISAAPLAPSAHGLLAPDTVAALTSAGGLIQLSHVWQDLLARTVFPHAHYADRKQQRTFESRLATESARAILLLIWQASNFVGDAERVAAGVAPLTDATPRNTHALAKFLSVDANDLDRKTKQVKGVVEAAEACGLVTRETLIGCRTRPLEGTRRLHQLMLELDARTRPIFTDVVAPSSGES